LYRAALPMGSAFRRAGSVSDRSAPRETSGRLRGTARRYINDMILGIDPKVDYAFKHLLGREATRPILIDVIDAVLHAEPGRRIRDIELLNPFNPKEALDDKLSILDIKARDQSGRQFNIEMQMLASPTYEKRILYYGTRLHQQQLHQEEEYAELKPTISISFLDDVLFPQTTEHHLRFRLLEESLRFPMTEDIEFHILELPKFTKALPELASDLDIWLYFLRHAAMMNVEAFPAELQRPLVLRAWEDLKMLSQAEIDRERYEARWKAQLDHNSLMRVKREIEEGKAAIEEGKAAIEEGKAAIEEGKAAIEEGKAAIAQMQAETEKSREKSEKLGLEKGEKIGVIHFCEQLLNRPKTPSEQLAALSAEELSRLAEELRNLVKR
jgi:predicted transposase/invertase (TIGR01784 family)